MSQSQYMYTAYPLQGNLSKNRVSSETRKKKIYCIFSNRKKTVSPWVSNLAENIAPHCAQEMMSLLKGFPLGTIAG